MFVKDIIKRHN